MKRSLLAVIAGAVAWLLLTGPQAQAACDYAIGGTPPYSGSQMITDINEELGCISSAIAAGVADGDKGDITVSSSGTVWSVDSGAVGVTELSGLGTGIADFLGTPSSANLATAVTGETGSGALVFGTSPSLTTPNLGTPSAVTLTNGTGLPIAGITGLGTGVGTWLATPSSANLRNASTDEVGTGALMFGLAPTMSDDLSCTGSQVVRRNAGDTAFECATVSGGSLGDGDYGDITVSGSGTVMSIDNDTVGEPELDLVTGNTAANGDCLVARPSGTGGTLEFTTCPGAGGGISDIVQDLTPQLGGALDTNGFAIELGSGNTDTSLTRSAAGQISVEGVVVPTVSSTSTLTNKTLTAPVISSIVNTGTLTLPTSTDTLVGRATTDTLTNKTLTAPVISTISNTGTITLPTATTTLVGRDTTDTLTNKSIAAGQITAGALNIGNNAATVGTVEMANGTTNTLSASGGNLSIEGNALYRAGGTDVALADGGTGASLADPNADRILFWDDSAGTTDWLTIGSGLSITGTTITATGGGGATPDVQSFTASGTWTKPSGPQTCLLEAGGAGGSGGRSTTGQSTGGGGGAYASRFLLMSSLGATETVTIGAGGTAITTANTNGNNGGNTTIGSLLTAYGGLGGGQSASGSLSGGNGGGWVSGGAPTPNGANSNAIGENSGARGGDINGGGVSSDGGDALRGGAGGGSMSADGFARSGGSSTYGGSGGASTNGSAATAGSGGNNGGGGGGGAVRGNFNSGAGGRGWARVTCW